MGTDGGFLRPGGAQLRLDVTPAGWSPKWEKGLDRIGRGLTPEAGQGQLLIVSYPAPIWEWDGGDPIGCRLKADLFGQLQMLPIA